MKIKAKYTVKTSIDGFGHSIVCKTMAEAEEIVRDILERHGSWKNVKVVVAYKVKES